VPRICTFARQNIAADPPILASRHDQLPQRSDYSQPGPAQALHPPLYYALNPGGLLILWAGPNQWGCMTSFSNSWTRKTKFTQEAATVPRQSSLFHRRPELAHFGPRPVAGLGPKFRCLNLLKVADRIILSTYAPAAVVVDDKMQVHQFRGRTELFLEHMPGPQPSSDSISAHEFGAGSARNDSALDQKRANRPRRAGEGYASGKKLRNKYQVVPFKIPGSDSRGSWDF